MPIELFDLACRGCASSSRDRFSQPLAVLFKNIAPRLYPSHSLPLRIHRAQFGSCRSHYDHLATDIGRYHRGTLTRILRLLHVWHPFDLPGIPTIFGNKSIAKLFESHTPVYPCTQSWDGTTRFVPVDIQGTMAMAMGNAND